MSRTEQNAPGPHGDGAPEHRATAADPFGPSHRNPDDHGPHPAPRNPLFRYIFSTDHKVIGIQFLISGLLFFLIGEAVLIRTEE